MVQQPLNILLITADQWRGDTLGSAGHPCVQTPHLDALASQGVLFRRHYTQASPCGPARASMLTGQYLFNHRQVGNWTPLSGALPTLATELRAANYDPVLVGFTDTPLDPALQWDALNDPAAVDAGEPERWVCPGFRTLEPFLYAQEFANWKAALRASGYEVPDGAQRTFLPHADTPRGKNFAPAFYAAEHSDTAFLANAAIRYIENAPPDRPWMLHFSCLRPHPPVVAPAPYHDMYDPSEMPVPVRPLSLQESAALHPFIEANLKQQDLREYFGSEGRQPLSTLGETSLDGRMRATYYGNCTEVDANVGRILAALERAGTRDRTLVIFTSDHGDQFGDNWLYGRRGFHDGHFHVPLIIRDPRPDADATRGTAVDDFSEHVDLLPTILEATSSPRPSSCDGMSLGARLWGGDAITRDAVHFELDFRDYPTQALANMLDLTSHESKFTAIRTHDHKYVHFPALPPLLFDLRNDPHETRNVAEDLAYQHDRRRLTEQMLNWRMRHEPVAHTYFHQVPGEAVTVAADAPPHIARRRAP